MTKCYLIPSDLTSIIFINIIISMVIKFKEIRHTIELL